MFFLYGAIDEDSLGKRKGSRSYWMSGILNGADACEAFLIISPESFFCLPWQTSFDQESSPRSGSPGHTKL